MKNNLLSLSILIIATACVPLDYNYLTELNNNSRFDYIYCILDKCTNDNYISLNSEIDHVFPGQKYIFPRHHKWEKVIHDSVSLYFIDATQVALKYGKVNPLTKEELDKIPESSILAEYRFSAKEFHGMKRSFSFPPDERMRGIWMRPSYDEVVNAYSK